MMIFEKNIIKNIIGSFEKRVNNPKVQKIEARKMPMGHFITFGQVDIQEHYVYRHYYYTEDREEITFYVGKGKGKRAYIFTELHRGRNWAECVNDLNVFYIDIIDIFKCVDDAYELESDLIGYYYLFKNECFGNVQVKSACIAMKEKMLSAQLSLFMDRNTPIDEIFWFFKMLNPEHIYWSNKYLKDEINRVLKDNKSKYFIHRIVNNGKAHYMYK